MTLDEPTIANLIHGCEQRRARMRDACVESEEAATGMLIICIDLVNYPDRLLTLSPEVRRSILKTIADVAAMAYAETLQAVRRDQSEEGRL